VPWRIFPKPNGVFDDPTALDTTDTVLDQHPTSSGRTVLGFLFLGQLATPRFLVGLGDDDAREREAHKAEILEQFAPVWQSIGRLKGDRFVMATAFIRVAQKRNRASGGSQQHVFHCMA